MNKQEAIEYWQLVYENNENYCDENWDADEKQAHQRWCEALRTVLDLLEEQREWIPVSERLPEYDNDVLATDGENIYVAYYWNKYWNSNDDRCCLELPVKAWMPLPEPYKEEVEHE